MTEDWTPDHWTHRARRWLGRSKAAPARIDRLHAESDELRSRLEEMAGALHRLESVVEELRSGLHDLAETQGEHDVGDSVDRLDATVREEGSLTRVAVADQRRDEMVERLVAEYGYDVPVAPGLSVITITWNHAGFLEESVASSLAVLDTLTDDLQGQVLVLDDHSTDESPEILERLARSDARIRVIRSPVNLTLSRARNALLHVCQTSHAFVLDADNVAFPEGASALFHVAREWDSAFTYGNVVKARPDGSEYIPASNEPPTGAFTIGNYIDSMAVVDVALLRRLGGYTLDPLLHSYDDYELVSRLGRLGELLAFVPTVVGRYRILDTSYIEAVGDSRVALGRLERTYRSDGGIAPADMAVLAAHPATGPLWATPAAVALRPALLDGLREPEADPRRSDGPRVLVVSSGGFRNIGDDAMARGVIKRTRRLVPHVRIDLVTDGDASLEDSGQLDEAVVWRGTLPEVLAGLDPNAVRSGCPDEMLAERIVAESGIGSSTVQLVDPSEYSLIVCSGGGNMNSVFVEHAARRAALAAVAGVAGVPVVCTGQGVGPFDNDAGGGLDARIVGYLIARSTSFGLRDPLSAELLAELDLDAPHVELVGDDAIGFPPATDAVVEGALAHAGVDSAAPFVAVHVRQASYVGVSDDAAADFAALADRVAAHRGASVLGVTVCDTPPVPEAVLLAQLGHGGRKARVPWRVLECHAEPDLLAGALGRADAALVHSYHAAVFALDQRIPTLFFVASDYFRRKAEGLRRLADLPIEFVVDTHDLPDADEVERRLGVVGAALSSRDTVFDATPLDDFFERVVAPVPNGAVRVRGDAS